MITDASSAAEERHRLDAELDLLFGREKWVAREPDVNDLKLTADNQFAYNDKRGDSWTFTVQQVGEDFVLPLKLVHKGAGGEVLAEWEWQGWQKQGSFWHPLTASCLFSSVTITESPLPGGDAKSRTVSQLTTYSVTSLQNVNEPIHSGWFIPVLPSGPNHELLDRSKPGDLRRKIYDLSIIH